MQLMHMQRTPKLNIGEQILNNPINENIFGTKGLTGGIEVLKLIKMSSDIDIDDLNKVSDEIDQINKGDQVDKKRCKC